MAWLRIATAAVVFAVWRRPWRLAARVDRRGRLLLVQLGVVLAAMNAVFYLAVARLPLATVAAVEFLGVVLLAAVGVRTPHNAAALALVVGGVAVLTDLRLVGQPLGSRSPSPTAPCSCSTWCSATGSPTATPARAR